MAEKKSAAKSTAAKPAVTERMYSILLRPIVTEKSTAQQEVGRLTFEVVKDATKPEIKKCVEALYKVKVQEVNTLNVKGKTKRFKGIKGRRSDVKKAIVRLAEGQNVDIAAGV